VVSRRTILFAIAAFAAALSLRVMNAGFAELSPIDELYHLKRMTHFVDFDADRNAFCPWPPLYDHAFGGLARLLGATTQAEVLERVRWFPPLFFALFVAAAFVWMERRFGLAAALAAAGALAASPFVVTMSWVASIDHHWTEPIFVVAILACVIQSRADGEGSPAGWGSLAALGMTLGLAITAAMFVQTALLVAAALAFVILFFTTDGRAGAIAFAIPALSIALYRATRPPGYPDNAWFLGWTHAALFGAAAVACAYLWWRKSRFFALLAGACVVLATPTAPAALLGGSHFFGGERWLQTISEFQPLWKAHGEDLLSIAVGLGAGALLVWRLRNSMAAFAILYLLLTVTSRRFWSVGIPLLAIAGAIAAASTARPRLRMLALAAVGIVPAIQLALWMTHRSPPMANAYAPWFRAARFLHEQPPGRTLAPWSVGHLLDVAGGRAVVVDNFGTMPDEMAFERAHDAFLTTHEDSLADYCDRNGIRFIVYENPRGLHGPAVLLGVDLPPKLAVRTVWSRAYAGAPLRFFRRVYARDRLVIVERR
jgi:transposase InsO family protein